MMPVILEAFGKRTDVYQVIGLKYNKGRGEYADFVHRNIQQIDLGMPPQNPADFCKLFINLRYIITDTQRLIGYSVYGQYI